MQRKALPAEQNVCLMTVLGACRADPVVVVEAESSVPSIRISLDHEVLGMQALRANHPITKIGNARIQKIL